MGVIHTNMEMVFTIDEPLFTHADANAIKNWLRNIEVSEHLRPQTITDRCVSYWGGRELYLQVFPKVTKNERGEEVPDLRHAQAFIELLVEFLEQLRAAANKRKVP